MKDIVLKIREIYIPFLIVSIGFVFFYILFRWIFDIELGILPLKENLLNFWLPIILPWIPVLIWLRRRLRILNLRGKSDNGYFFYQIVMVAAMAIPIINSQDYITKNSYDLKEVYSAGEIQQWKDEKYFDISSFNLDKNAAVSYATARTSGRQNQNLNLSLYVAVPFENYQSIWYGVKYRKRLDNNASQAIKNLEYRRFEKASETDFLNHNFYGAKYFEKIGYSDDKDGYLEAIQREYSGLKNEEIIVLIPVTEEFDKRLGNSLPWTFGSYILGAVILLFMILIPKIDREEFSRFKTNKPLKEDDLKDILEILNPFGTYPATAILVLSNILVFIVMVIYGLNIISPTPLELLEIGGNRRFEVMNGEYWRLFTAVFIHSGILHLFMNLIGLGLGCRLLEKVLGSSKLIVVYIICGIVASLVSIYWNENSVSIGASGAIFGLYGIILAFTVFKIYPNHLRKFTWVLLGLYAGLSLLYGFSGGIDNAAHIGGLVCGFLISLLLIHKDKENLLKNASP